MNNPAVHGALGKLKLEHRQFGLMIDELETAVNTLEGACLVNAIDDISLRYGCPIA